MTKTDAPGNRSRTLWDIAVIGGGAAGFMAALGAAESAPGRLAVLVLDAGTPLAKLLATGGGRCNLTNATFDPRALAANYPRGEYFLRSVFTRWGPGETMDWFRARGLALKTEAGGRVFPASDRAEEVRDLLLGQARKSGVVVRARTPATGLRRDGNGFLLLAGKDEIRSRRVILATGGDPGHRSMSGYNLAQALGHAVTPLRPSLTGLMTAVPGHGVPAGVTLADAAATAIFGGKKVASVRGGFLFTHRGISGPLALEVSSRCAFIDFGPKTTLALEINLLPELSREEMERKLEEDFQAQPKRSVINALAGLVPRALAQVLLADTGVDAAKPSGELSRNSRRTILDRITRFRLTVTGRERGGEMVTAGGVVLDEVDQKGMESKLAPGLHL
jgi:predicted Rossmann fold flavoprotein